ncbi:E3 ubiquitin-protein ligase E3D isoform X2 [Chiloscyllium punctatum]|uniref:E3 ubiquitin-protein ligase E3D isoform X2 n=1 Tax=Chiloscyllium punctatum TaxID=137246 RepID=UPI003B64253A
METSLLQTQCFLEIRSSAQSGLLIIGNLPEKYSELQVTLGPSSIRLCTAEQRVNLDLPVGVRIVPPSCRSLQYVTGDGFHMRLQVQINQSAELVPTVIETLQAQTCYNFQCQACGQSVLKKQMFQRVLPLPSGNWNDLVEHWCCHPDPFAKALRPRLDDCLLGDTFLLVNAVSVDKTAVHEETVRQSDVKQVVQVESENNTIVCTRCRKLLGIVSSSDTIKFYITEVLVQPLTSKVLKRQIHGRSWFVETVVAGRLKEFSTAQCSFRFCIQGHDGKTYILLWLLNSDSLLVRSHNDSNSDFTRVDKNAVKSESSHKLCEGNNAVKVLYLPCLNGRNKLLSKDLKRMKGLVPDPKQSNKPGAVEENRFG